MSAAAERLPPDGPTAIIGGRLAKLGYEGELGDALFRWAGNENYEERLDGAEQIDPVLLGALRSQSG